MDDQIQTGLDRGIREFNEGAFFEAHDTLEDVWMDARGECRLFLQGLIQLAIGYYHLSCENYTGADHLLTRGMGKLDDYRPAAYGVDLDPLLVHVRRTIGAVRRMAAGGGAVDVWTYPQIEATAEGPTAR